MSSLGRGKPSSAKVGLFDRMLRIEERERFVAHITRAEGSLDDERCRECVEYALSEQCARDLERLRAGDYFLDYPTKFVVPKTTSDRKRTLYIFKAGNDHFLLRLIAFGLRPTSETLPDTLYSFRPDKSGVAMVREAHRVNANGELYALRSDVRHYCNMIDPDLTVSVLERYLSDDPDLLSFFAWLLRRRRCYEWGECVEDNTGGLPGTAVSNFFMGIYLLDADARISSLEGCCYYGRYGDDVVAFFDSEKSVNEGYRVLLEELERVGLEPNFEKTKLIMPGEPIEIMGVEMRHGQIDVSRRTTERLKKRLRRRAQDASIQKKAEGLSADEAGRRIIKMIERTFCNPEANAHVLTWSRWAFPLITSADSLKELDAYAQKCIRYVMTGTWGKGQYRVKYSKLRALGYHPQVGKYYDYVNSCDSAKLDSNESDT